MGAKARFPGVDSSRRVLGYFLAALISLSGAFATAQAIARSPVTPAPLDPSVPTTADALLEQMSQIAGVIFAGQVLAVRGPAAYPESAAGVVEIDLRVDEEVRGPAAGSVYTLREWSGLWPAVGSGGFERYRVGQRLLVFLRTPNASGLSSPVHGTEGAVPLRGGGTAPRPDDTTTAAAEWMVDLRWLQARTLHMAPWLDPPVRTIGAGKPRAGPVPEERPSLVHELPVPWSPSTVWTQPTAVTPTALQEEPLSQVLSLCRARLRLRDAPE